jgi:hypothetical protein
MASAPSDRLTGLIARIDIVLPARLLDPAALAAIIDGVAADVRDLAPSDMSGVPPTLVSYLFSRQTVPGAQYAVDPEVVLRAAHWQQEG